MLDISGDIAKVNPYRYAGYRYDEGTKLYFLQSRYYEATNGVFLTADVDPGADDHPLSQNGYNYAFNNPIEYIDPNGEHPIIYLAIFRFMSNVVHIYMDVLVYLAL